MKIGIAIILLLAGIFNYRNYTNHRYDEYLTSPEAVVVLCLEKIEAETKTFPQSVSLYKYMKWRGKEAGQESERLINLYNDNLILEEMDSPYCFSEIAKETLEMLPYCEVSEPEKIIQNTEDEVYYRVKISHENYEVKGTREAYDEELWIRLNQASNGLWYISMFTARRPEDWNGNTSLTEKNKEFGEALIQNIKDEEIYQMFTDISATQLNGNSDGKGFFSPVEWEEWACYLDFLFGSYDKAKLAASYDETRDCYLFTSEEVGRYIWDYLGEDEYENSALGPNGYYDNYFVSRYEIKKDGQILLAFPKERVLDIKTYHPDCMRVTRKEVLENGRTMFEIAYEDTSVEPAIINTQRIEVRAMNSGYRYLSYFIIEQGKESEGNRILAEFTGKEWLTVKAQYYAYGGEAERPKRNFRGKFSDFDSLQNSLKQLKIGAEIKQEELPKDAELISSFEITAKSNELQRRLEMCCLEVEGEFYLLLRTYYTILTAGEGDGLITMSLGGNSFMLRPSEETVHWFHFKDYQSFQEIVMMILDS